MTVPLFCIVVLYCHSGHEGFDHVSAHSTNSTQSTGATIFQPAKGVTQSGRGKLSTWRVEFDLSAPRDIEPIMGWTSATDMRQELGLKFDTKEDAIAYCERNEIDYRVREPKKRRVRIRTYADNFSSATLRGPGTEPV